MFSSILATLSILLSSLFSVSLPVADAAPTVQADAATVSQVGAPICPDFLCYSEDIEPDAWVALHNSGFLDDMTEETEVTFMGYIDAPSYDEPVDYQAVQVTDAEGVTYVFSYGPSGIILT